MAVQGDLPHLGKFQQNQGRDHPLCWALLRLLKSWEEDIEDLEHVQGWEWSWGGSGVAEGAGRRKAGSGGIFWLPKFPDRREQPGGIRISQGTRDRT